MLLKSTRVAVLVNVLPLVKTKEYGVTRHHALVHFTDDTVCLGEALESAQLTRLDQFSAKLMSADLFSAGSLFDSANSILRVRRFGGQRLPKRWPRVLVTTGANCALFLEFSLLVPTG